MINVVSTGLKLGKHKVKRYLYHFTSASNYQKILNEKKINMSHKDPFLKSPGIFLVDLPNFTNQWLNNETYWNSQNLALNLLEETCKNQDKLVCLRIPTEKLDHSKLRIRSEDRFFKKFKSFSKVTKHLEFGDSVKSRSYYIQRGESLEHIYQNDIPADIAELVGIVDIDKNKVCRTYTKRGAKQKNIVISGFGGQGVLFLGTIISNAAKYICYITYFKVLI